MILLAGLHDRVLPVPGLQTPQATHLSVLLLVWEKVVPSRHGSQRVSWAAVQAAFTPKPGPHELHAVQVDLSSAALNDTPSSHREHRVSALAVQTAATPSPGPQVEHARHGPVMSDVAENQPIPQGSQTLFSSVEQGVFTPSPTLHGSQRMHSVMSVAGLYSLPSAQARHFVSVLLPHAWSTPHPAEHSLHNRQRCMSRDGEYVLAAHGRHKLSEEWLQSVIRPLPRSQGLQVWHAVSVVDVHLESTVKLLGHFPQGIHALLSLSVLKVPTTQAEHPVLAETVH